MFLETAKKFVLKKLKETSTQDGLVLVGCGIAFLVLKPIAGLVAYAAIGYGAWIIWKNES